jgi:hypothetical protein
MCELIFFMRYEKERRFMHGGNGKSSRYVDKRQSAKGKGKTRVLFLPASRSLEDVLAGFIG